MFHGMFVYQSELRRVPVQGTENETLTLQRPTRNLETQTTICFTICLFFSPDFDGHRAPRYVHDMFVH